MKFVFCNIWKSDKGVVIRDLDDTLFSFSSFLRQDKEYVFNERWAYVGNILFLKEIIS